MTTNPENILILGNGFDLNLGLPTGYCDFIKGSEFQNLVYQGNELATYLNQRHDLENWIDIENELKKYSQSTLDAQFEGNYNSLCDALMEYLNRLDYDKINSTSKAYKLINSLKDVDVLIIDFNYTKTTEVLMQQLGMSDNDIAKRLVKIHGSAQSKQIIFGVEDRANVKREHVFLKKSYNIHFKPINFKQVFAKVENVIFFGHSLGETDHTYFQDFIFSSAIGNSKSILHFYYYGNQGYKELFMQLDDLSRQNLSTLRQNNQVFLNNSQ